MSPITKFEVLIDLGYINKESCCIMIIKEPTQTMSGVQMGDIFTNQFPDRQFSGFKTRDEKGNFVIYYRPNFKCEICGNTHGVLNRYQKAWQCQNCDHLQNKSRGEAK